MIGVNSMKLTTSLTTMSKSLTTSILMRSAQWDMMLTWLQALLKLMMMKVAIAAKLTKAQTDGWPIMHTACWFADWLAMMEHTI
jgi:hypothetical protein